MTAARKTPADVRKPVDPMAAVLDSLLLRDPSQYVTVAELTDRLNADHARRGSAWNLRAVGWLLKRCGYRTHRTRLPGGRTVRLLRGYRLRQAD